MARTHKSHNRCFVHSFLTSMSFNGILQLVLVVSALAERCTRAVPIQKYPSKKVHVLRRLPASCSNWDKAWSWITNVDCGTKYRLDYITVPPREVVQYKLEYVCCDGDTDCEEAENIHSSTFDSTDEKFLAIVLGSTAAAVIIIIIVVAISLCTKRRRCMSNNRERGHAYNRAESEECHKGDATEEKICRHEDIPSDGECKLAEPVYAEIGEETLPRYTDLFFEEKSTPQNPFVHATAPVYYSGAKESGDRRASNTEPKQLAHYTNTSDVTPLQSSAPIQEEANYASVVKQTRTGAAEGAANTDNANNPTEMRYYNVREKKKKKKRSTQPGRENRRRSKTSGVEMMVKSTSASDSVTVSRSSTETSITQQQQKRRSAPPDSVDVRSMQLPGQQDGPAVRARNNSSSNSCDVISVCTIHEKPCPSPISPHQGASPNMSPTSERMALKKSPSAGSRQIQILPAGGTSPRIKCRSYENIPRSRSHPNSINPVTSLDNVHQIPHSKSLSLRVQNSGNNTNKCKVSKSSSLKQCSNSPTLANGDDKNNTASTHAQHSSLKSHRTSPNQHGEKHAVSSSSSLPHRHKNQHGKPSDLPIHKNSTIPRIHCSPETNHRGSRSSPTNHAPTYDTLQYSRSPSPDHFYQKLETTVEEDASWKV